MSVRSLSGMLLTVYGGIWPVGWRTYFRELCERDRLRPQTRTGRRRTLCFVAVTLIAAVGREQLPAVLRIAARRRGLRHDRAGHDDSQSQRDKCFHREPTFHLLSTLSFKLCSFHRGCVTTSMSAGSPSFYDIERALESRRQVLRIGDRAFRVHAETARQPRVVDVRVLDRRSNPRRRHATLMPVGHALNVHDFLMVGAVVVHDRQQRNPVVRRRPQARLARTSNRRRPGC